MAVRERGKVECWKRVELYAAVRAGLGFLEFYRCHFLLLTELVIIVIVTHFYMWLKNNKFIIIKCINVYKFAKCANVGAGVEIPVH